MTLEQYLASISTAYKHDIPTELYEGKIPNLTEEIINQIAHKINLHFILAKDPEGNVCMANNNEIRSEFRQTFSPMDILDYAYAILHSSSFHSADKKILKTNFPYPKNADIFWKLAEIGSKIKQIHLFENPKTKNSITYQQKTRLALSETNLLIEKIDKIILE
ncbi:type ISP restriction/modification enzyme [Flavobacterium sp. M31R6]|uniref:type ISP restriction/modification enzyme n=1 Tax=Flavobacterium sp. M31R6 TaxID=2739062 RepID=UPI0015680D59|nr:type ISP restriction/modification enzyme [Flavobacterium sp. M31R6]QKJ62526.1 hypothetical protein HQN62_05055 [Flavobacterium sp. M31R6]